MQQHREFIGGIARRIPKINYIFSQYIDIASDLNFSSLQQSQVPFQRQSLMQIYICTDVQRGFNHIWVLEQSQKLCRINHRARLDHQQRTRRQRIRDRNAIRFESNLLSTLTWIATKWSTISSPPGREFYDGAARAASFPILLYLFPWLQASTLPSRRCCLCTIFLPHPENEDLCLN